MNSEHGSSSQAHANKARKPHILSAPSSQQEKLAQDHAGFPRSSLCSAPFLTAANGEVVKATGRIWRCNGANLHHGLRLWAPGSWLFPASPAVKPCVFLSSQYHVDLKA